MLCGAAYAAQRGRYSRSTGRSAQRTQLMMGRDGLEEASPQALVANRLGERVEEL